MDVKMPRRMGSLGDGDLLECLAELNATLEADYELIKAVLGAAA